MQESIELGQAPDQATPLKGGTKHNHMTQEYVVIQNHSGAVQHTTISPNTIRTNTTEDLFHTLSQSSCNLQSINNPIAIGERAGGQ